MRSIDRIDNLIQFQKRFEKHVTLGKGTLRIDRRIPKSLILPVVLTESKEIIGYIKIELLIWLQFKDIIKHPEIIKREYPDYKNILKDIKTVYPSLKPNTWMTFYGFKFLKRSNLGKLNKKIKKIYQKLKPDSLATSYNSDINIIDKKCSFKKGGKNMDFKEKEIKTEKAVSLLKILEALEKNMPRGSSFFNRIQTYPRADHPDPSKRGNSFMVLIQTIISQRTTLEKEMQAGSQLFAKYQTPEEIANASVKEIASLIKPAGMSESKADAIIEVSKEILRRYKGNLDTLKTLSLQEAREELMALPRVGPKTADCLLLWSFNKPILPVDINVYKVSKQLGLVPEKANREVTRTTMEELLNHNIELFKKAHIYFLALGKFYCKLTPLCEKCPVTEWCKYFSKY